MHSSNRFLRFDLKKHKCMQHLLSPAPSALSPCIANGSHQFLAASDYTAGLSCLVVSCLRSIHSCVDLLSCYATAHKWQQVFVQQDAPAKDRHPLNLSCQVLFSQLGAGQLLSSKHRHRQDHPLSFLSRNTSKGICRDT